MRQAGRSLPEYRGCGARARILDAIAQPDLAAELTLQPVRRYGVDAAILYSDIVVPARRHRLRRRRRARHRSRGRPSRSARRPTSTGCARSSPRPTCPTSSRRSQILVGRADACRSSASPARRSPWPATSSRAGRRAPTPCTKALMYAEPDALGRRCSTGWPTWPSRRLRAQVEAGAAAVQLFDSWVGALRPRRLRAPRAAGVAQGARAGWPTSACPASTSASAPASCCG